MTWCGTYFRSRLLGISVTSALYGENLIGFQQRARVIHTRISSSRAGHRTMWLKTPHHYRGSSRLITIAWWVVQRQRTPLARPQVRVGKHPPPNAIQHDMLIRTEHVPNGGHASRRRRYRDKR